MKTKIIVVANQKGGVGKSTIAFHLAHAAALENGVTRVLAIDVDSQGTLSQYLTGNLDVVKVTQGGVNALFDGSELAPVATTHDKISLLHGHRELDRFDKDGAVEDRVFGQESAVTLRDLGYDYIVIDTPPAPGVRQLGPLFWADLVVLPVEPSMAAITGLESVLEGIQGLESMRRKVPWVCVMNRFNSRGRTHRELEALMHETYNQSGKDRVLATLATRIAVADAMDEMPSQPVWGRKGAPREVCGQWLEFCRQVLQAAK